MSEYFSEDEGDTSMETSFSSTCSQVDKSLSKSTSSIDVFSKSGMTHGLNEVLNNLLENKDYEEGAAYFQKIMDNFEKLENPIIFTFNDDDGSIAGFLICSTSKKPILSSKHDCISFFVTIEAISVSSEKRRRGIGSDLVKDFEREMVALSHSFMVENNFVSAVTVVIECKSSNLINFWKQQGFCNESQHLLKRLKCAGDQILDLNGNVIPYLSIPKVVLPIQKERARSYIPSVKNHGTAYKLTAKGFDSQRKTRIRTFQTWWLEAYKGIIYKRTPRRLALNNGNTDNEWIYFNKNLNIENLRLEDRGETWCYFNHEDFAAFFDKNNGPQSVYEEDLQGDYLDEWKRNYMKEIAARNAMTSSTSSSTSSSTFSASQIKPPTVVGLIPLKLPNRASAPNDQKYSQPTRSAPIMSESETSRSVASVSSTDGDGIFPDHSSMTKSVLSSTSTNPSRSQSTFEEEDKQCGSLGAPTKKIKLEIAPLETLSQLPVSFAPQPEKFRSAASVSTAPKTLTSTIAINTMAVSNEILPISHFECLLLGNLTSQQPSWDGSCTKEDLQCLRGFASEFPVNLLEECSEIRKCYKQANHCKSLPFKLKEVITWYRGVKYSEIQ